MSVKISQLSASSDITSDDFFPVVDSGSLTTKRASAQQMLDYVTGSTFYTLTVTTLDGTTAQFTTITGSTVTGSTALFSNMTASAALFSGDIRVLGTASITQLNTVGQTSLLIGDKYITILSGGIDHTGINGSGFLWGTSSGAGETTGALGEHAHILYDASRDALEIFPGLYVTGSTTVFDISGTTAQFTTITGSTGIFTNLTASSFSASQPSVVDVNSTSAALRVTQRGTGQSIRVEDSTNPDSSPFVVDAAGFVGISTATPGALLDVAGNALSSTSSYTAEFKASSGTTNAGRTLFSQNSTYAFAMSPLVTSATNGRVEFQYIERSTGNLLATPLTLRGDGKVGVGTVGPSKSLHINNSGLLIDGTNTVESSSFAARMIVDSGVSTGHTLADFRNSTGSKLFVGGTNVGIGTSSPSAVLDVNGNTVISGNLNVTGSISAPTGTFTMLSGSSGNITISGSLSGMIAALTSSVTDYVLVAADSGKVVVLSSSSGITASIPTGLPVGFTTTIVQNGSGSIFVSASSGVVIRNRQNHTRTAGLYATVAIIGTGSNSYIFAGDTTS